MARLAKPYKFPKFDVSNFEDYEKKSDEAFDAMGENNLVRFPAGDGYAFYFIKSRKPLVLQHVPYGDAWQLPAAYIRGLTLRDVDAMIYREQALRELFGSRGKK